MFQTKLLVWYSKHKRVLPWRLTNDPYLIWISEVMLQQTQVITVIPYYQKFVETFPSVYELANSELQQLLKLWQGLGYYSRARNLHKAAKSIVDEHQGQFPKTYHEISQLSGVGPYIAAAVSSIAFQLSYAVVDGNVKRVLSRLFCCDLPVNDSKSNKQYQTKADALLYIDKSGDYNQAIMELGALICKPQKPDCVRCPVLEVCQGYDKMQTNIYPFKLIKKKSKTRERLSFIVENKGRLLMSQNKETGLLGGLWAFPQFEKKNNESQENILHQLISEASGGQEFVSIKLMSVKHIYTHFKEDILPVVIKIKGDITLIPQQESLIWVTLTQLKKLPITGACQKILHLYQEYKS
ncbi:MAG: A/G-specific adenine glycosylase [Deltaproteobacteria bacterium]|nr:A/G-specific adenine glycosylase [Deltaproteobacteria bacterium]MBT4527228.1 A/G-specific adenine glycosylase [Deltaproteobacteria bacterium]